MSLSPPLFALFAHVVSSSCIALRVLYIYHQGIQHIKSVFFMIGIVHD